MIFLKLGFTMINVILELRFDNEGVEILKQYTITYAFEFNVKFKQCEVSSF